VKKGLTNAGVFGDDDGNEDEDVGFVHGKKNMIAFTPAQGENPGSQSSTLLDIRRFCRPIYASSRFLLIIGSAVVCSPDYQPCPKKKKN